LWRKAATNKTPPLITFTCLAMNSSCVPCCFIWCEQLQPPSACRRRSFLLALLYKLFLMVVINFEGANLLHQRHLVRVYQLQMSTPFSRPSLDPCMLHLFLDGGVTCILAVLLRCFSAMPHYRCCTCLWHHVGHVHHCGCCHQHHHRRRRRHI
jgi:hypothetical protein